MDTIKRRKSSAIGLYFDTFFFFDVVGQRDVNSLWQRRKTAILGTLAELKL
jgi:hypothetical protein